MPVIELHQSEIADGLLEVEVPEGIRVLYWTNRRTTMVTINTDPELFDVSGERRVFSMRQQRKVTQNAGGNTTNIKGNVYAPVMSGIFHNPVNINNNQPNQGVQGVFGDSINISHISGSSNVAIGRNARSNTSSSSVPQPDITIEIPIGISVLITNY